MTTTRRAAGLALAVLPLLTGCIGIGDLEKPLMNRAVESIPSPKASGELFLGVRTKTAEVPYQLGVKVEHVFPNTAAAVFGIQKGDEIRAVAGRAVRTTADLGALLGRGPSSVGAISSATGLPVGKKSMDPIGAVYFASTLVYARGGEEYTIADFYLGDRGHWQGLRDERVLADATSSETSVPLLFTSSEHSLAPAFVARWFGVAAEAPVTVYANTEIVPLRIIGGIGIIVFKRETVPVVGSSRTLFVTWPLVFRSSGTGHVDLGDQIPPPPEGTADL